MASRRNTVVAAFVIFGLVLTLPATAAGPKTKLASKAANGDAAGDRTDATAISGDGTVAAFVSNAENLPQGDGTTTQLYARDVDAGRTFLVSRASNGDAADEGNQEPWLSASGRYVAFISNADNLPGGDGVTRLIQVHDLETRRTRLASQNSAGDPVDENAGEPSISGNGRLVAFLSSAGNLPASASIGTGLYIHDRQSGNTSLASRASDGTAVEVRFGQISIDGGHVAFSSRSDDLPGGDGSTTRIYVRDLDASKTKLISKRTDGELADGDCEYPSVAANGAVAAFVCTASNLPGGDGSTDLVYARELAGGGSTRLVSKNANGDPAADTSYDPFVSGNGKVVAFYTNSDNLPGNDMDSDVYAYDLQTGALQVTSRNSDGEPSDEFAEAYPPSLSHDGAYAVFRSSGSNLPGTGGIDTQLFVRGPLR